MAGTQEPGGTSGDAEPMGWRALVEAPVAVIRLLRGEPILLIGMGAAVLLTLIAIFGPGDAQVYALILAVLVVVVVVIRAVTLRRERAESKPGSEIDSRDSTFVDVKMRSRGGIINRIRSRGSSFKNVKMD